MPEQDPIRAMIEAGMVVLEMMKPMLDTLEGYQAECRSRGYTEDEARRMAVDLHYLMTHVNAPKEGT